MEWKQPKKRHSKQKQDRQQSKGELGVRSGGVRALESGPAEQREGMAAAACMEAALDDERGAAAVCALRMDVRLCRGWASGPNFLLKWPALA
jgi:hypothetical protein